MNCLIFALVGFIIGSLLVGFILKSKNSVLKTQIDFMKEQEVKNDEFRNKLQWILNKGDFSEPTRSETLQDPSVRPVYGRHVDMPGR